MADIKTHLRELSVATTIGLLSHDVEFELTDLYSSSCFIEYAKKAIDNDITGASNLLDYTIFPNELQIIIDNGYKLGKTIYEHPSFEISKDDPIKWLGNDTQKGNPVDIIIGDYGFSLKEESFILENMGFYKMLNSLTGSNYKRGLHIFRKFAPEEYDNWFNYTWNSLITYLKNNDQWVLKNGTNISKVYISGSNVLLNYNADTSSVPISISTNAEYMKFTTSKTREKVFSKWINQIISNDVEYIGLKKICSKVAGKKAQDKINSEFDPTNIYDFFQIYPFEYYYAKTTTSETTILKVPARKNFSSSIEFKGCHFYVPSSQLNLITTFQNKNTGKILEFRNECRFSHGQFNGTPEAKMYVSRNTSLLNLYEPLD